MQTSILLQKLIIFVGLTTCFYCFRPSRVRFRWAFVFLCYAYNHTDLTFNWFTISVSANQQFRTFQSHTTLVTVAILCLLSLNWISALLRLFQHQVNAKISPKHQVNAEVNYDNWDINACKNVKWKEKAHWRIKQRRHFFPCLWNFTAHKGQRLKNSHTHKPYYQPKLFRWCNPNILCRTKAIGSHSIRNCCWWR